MYILSEIEIKVWFVRRKKGSFLKETNPKKGYSKILKVASAKQEEWLELGLGNK